MNPTDLMQKKCIPQHLIASKISEWKQKGEVIVFTNGCFDVIHRGHIDYLSKARMLGSRLVIGINSDASVRRIKGANRPLQDETSRALILASMFFVDAVVLFDDDTPYELIRTVKPDVLVKGSDYRAEEIVGYDIVTAWGGRVETLDYLEGYSTTAIEQRIRNNG
jgi:D-glycero-beta-D-manno-heptose 1-phosphate adenylyltransferase